MGKIVSFIKNAFLNTRSMLFGEYLRDAEIEDPYSYKLLINYLLIKNAGRALLLTFFQFVIGIIYVATVGSLDKAGAFRCVGAFILIASAPIFFIIFNKFLQKRNPEHDLLRKMIYLYWVVFSIGGATVTASEIIGGTLYSFLILFAVFLAIPVAKPVESAFFAGVIIVELILYGVFSASGALYWIAAAVAVVAYLWIAAVNCCCSSCMWLSNRRLDIVEERCAQISKKDTLTGLLNKAGLTELFNEKYSGENSDSGKKIAVIIIDIDNFRAFNHAYGYDKSDNYLYNICNCIKIMSKPYTDMISRFGGDDFVLVVEDMTEIAVVTLAEQLRRSVETMALPFGKGVITISVGISSLREIDGRDTYSALLNEADDQLIIAKKAGKNCVGFMGRPFIHENRKEVK